MIYDDWVYIGEGGKHAVFAYRGCEVSIFHNKVLRLPKSVSSKECLKSQSPREIFQFKIIKCILRGYIDHPEAVLLEPQFLRDLWKEAKRTRRIPDSRLEDWNPDFECMSPIKGILLPNYQSISLPFSVELKPKAGYLPSSILVHPKRRFKYSHSRYQILQKLNYNSIVEKGWNRGSKLEKMSKYDPLDLFSGDWERISRAIRALCKCPQNNLKIYSRGRLILSQDHLHLDGFGTGLERMGDDAVAVDTIDEEYYLARFQTILTDLLYNSSFLSNLLDFQKRIDILDVDGAILIHERLLNLCCGDSIKAEELIDYSYYDIVQEELQNLSRFDEMNMIELHQTIGTNTEEYNSFIEQLCFSLEVGENKMDEAYSISKSCIDHLNSFDCARLLGNWLISLTITDLSFFVCFKERVNGNASSFEIKIVDYDCKPSMKLRNRENLERMLNLFIDCQEK